MLQYAGRVKELKAVEKATGRKPVALTNRPQPGITEGWFLGAYTTLARGRIHGEPVRLSEMEAYIKLCGVICPPCEFVSVMRAMDAEYFNSIKESS